MDLSLPQVTLMPAAKSGNDHVAVRMVCVCVDMCVLREPWLEQTTQKHRLVQPFSASKITWKAPRTEEKTSSQTAKWKPTIKTFRYHALTKWSSARAIRSPETLGKCWAETDCLGPLIAPPRGILLSPQSAAPGDKP